MRRAAPAAFLPALLALAGCASAPPEDVDNLCAIFEEKPRWYRDARAAERDWDIPVPVLMAFLHQESRFESRARPPRKKILGFIPGPRPSDAYGYSQALRGTWRDYQRAAGRYGADRDDFGDAVHFVGWYNAESRRRNGIGSDDAYRLYLAYHEGQGGYARGTWRGKSWLQQVARKVARRAQRYDRQLRGCAGRLRERRGWFRWL